MPQQNTPPAPTSATLAVSNIPSGDLTTRVVAIANAAKSMTWHGFSEGATMPPDHMFLRGALALIHMLEASEPMREASALASLLATSFEVVANDSPLRAAVLATVLDDPGQAMAAAVMANRRIMGLPPQLDLVPDIDETEAGS